jgi:hypothetical protein
MNDCRDAGCGQAALGRADAREDEMVIAPRPSVLQPVGERLPDVDRERKLFVPTSLAADHHLPGAPIDVVQLDRGDLARA